jgi:hypothetical protein
MNELVVVALVTGGCSVLGQFVIAKSTAKTHSAVTDVRLNAIESKVDRHNRFMERLAVLENHTENLSEILVEIKDNCKETRRECSKRNDIL